jgi:hypothetical protein
MQKELAQLKTYEEIKKESEKVVEIFEWIEIWHPLGKHLNISKYKVLKYFGKKVWIKEWGWDRVQHTTKGKKLYDVFDNHGEKIFNAYGYWFEWIGEEKLILEIDGDLFKV